MPWESGGAGGGLVVQRLLPADAITVRNPGITINSLDEDSSTGWIELNYTAAAAQSSPDAGLNYEIGIVDAMGNAVGESSPIGPTSVVVEVDGSELGNFAVGALLYGTANAAGIGPGMQCDGADFGGFVTRDIGPISSPSALYTNARSLIAGFANNNVSDSSVRGVPFTLLSDSRAVLERELNLTAYNPNPWNRWTLFFFALAAETSTARFRVTTLHSTRDDVLDLAGAP